MGPLREIKLQLGNLFKRGSFVQNASLVMLSRGGIFLLALFTTPIISRIFLPTEYGLFSLFNATIATLITIAGLELPTAIVLPKDKNTVYKLIQTVLFFTFLLIAFLLIGIALGGPLLVEELNLKHPIFLYLLVPALGLGSLLAVYNNWLVRQKSFTLISISVALSNLIIRVITILLGIFITQDFWGLAVGLLLGQVIQTAYYTFTFYRQEPEFFNIRITLENIRSTLKLYRKYPTYLLPSRVLTNFRNQILLFLLAAYFGQEFLGYFSMTSSLVTIPLQLLSFALSSVFFEKSASLAHQDKVAIGTRLNKLFKALFLLGFPIFLVGSFAGDWLASFFLGPQWVVTGYLAQIVSIQAFYMFVISPFLGLYQIFEREKLRFIMNILYLFGNLASIYFGQLFLNPWWTMLILSLFNSTFHTIQGYQLYQMTGMTFRKQALPKLVLFIVVALAVLGLRLFYFESPLLDLLRT